MPSPHSTRLPRWSATSLLIVALASGFATVALVALLVHRPVWDELRLVAAALTAPVWMFLCFILYRGTRFEREDSVRISWVRPATIAEHMPVIDSFGHFTSAGAEHGAGGIVVGLLLDILVAVVLTAVAVVLLWVGINFALVAALVIWVPLVYMFKRSVRTIVARGRTCRRNPTLSAWWASVYTAVAIGCLMAIVTAGERLWEGPR
jgi:hypothetical protein